MNRIASWLKKYFIPHAGNDYKPHFLRHETMMLSLLVVIVVELAFLAQVFIVFDKTKFLAAVLPGALTALTNKERTENNLPVVVENDLLKKAAELKAQDMANKGYFAHTSPEGITPWYWLDQVGYRYSMAGENLAVNFSESRDVDQAWMDSPTHRANMLKDGYTEIGIGVATGFYEGRNTVFVAQFFGTPIKKVAPVTTPTPVNATTKPKTTPAPAPTPTPRITQAPAPVITPIKVLGEEAKTVTSAATATKAESQSRIKSLMQRILTSPLHSVNYFYVGVLVLLILALMLALFIKSEIQHPLMIARGVTLMVIIILLFFVNIRVTHRETTKVPVDLSASVILAN